MPLRKTVVGVQNPIAKSRHHKKSNRRKKYPYKINSKLFWASVSNPAPISETTWGAKLFLKSTLQPWQQ